jgi:DNA-binding transcriptional LysR family regulator
MVHWRDSHAARAKSMEMHQIRYFLAAARTLNFTRAAEECNVAQPSLTRAIQQLEEELGGDLFRRERKLSHLTDLGQRMLPLMQQCYDMAQGAKSLASSIKRGEIASLRLALSHTVDISLLVPFLSELNRAFNGLELKFLRGSGLEVAEKLKQGDAELGIAGPLDQSWARFDVWPLFTEGFALVVNAGHRLARKSAIDLDELTQERLLRRPYCEQAEQMAALLRSRNVKSAHTHELSSERDLLSLLEAKIGVAVVPRSIAVPETLIRVPINEFPLSRTVYLYAVAGRPRGGPATTFMKQLASADWAPYAS